MCEVVKVSTVKTRKDHKCFGCNRNFPASCELERQVIRNEHELYSIYLCPTCQIITKNVRKAHSFRCGMDSTR